MYMCSLYCSTSCQRHRILDMDKIAIYMYMYIHETHIVNCLKNVRYIYHLYYSLSCSGDVFDMNIDFSPVVYILFPSLGDSAGRREYPTFRTS